MAQDDGSQPDVPVAPSEDAENVEISSRGKIVVRSSSHPPVEPAEGGEQVAKQPAASGVPGARLRTKKDTPLERPRRRQLRAELAPERRSEPRVSAGGSVLHVSHAASASSAAGPSRGPRARAGGQASDRVPEIRGERMGVWSTLLWLSVLGVAVALAAALWLGH